MGRADMPISPSQGFSVNISIAAASIVIILENKYGIMSTKNEYMVFASLFILVIILPDWDVEKYDSPWRCIALKTVIFISYVTFVATPASSKDRRD